MKKEVDSLILALVSSTYSAGVLDGVEGKATDVLSISDEAVKQLLIIFEREKRKVVLNPVKQWIRERQIISPLKSKIPQKWLNK